MIITVDIDNVLNNLTESVLVMYNAMTGKNIQLEDITTYNFYNCLDSEDAEKIIDLFKEEKLWNRLLPIEGSQEALEKLNENHRLILATATAPENFSWKVTWIKRMFPFISDDQVVRIMDKSLLKTDVIIEDCMETLTKTFAERICLDYPWNRSESKDYVYGIRRAYNWSDIVEYINIISKENVYE